MPRLIVTPRAANGIARCLRFIAGKNRRAAAKAALAIKDQLQRLSAHPDMGRPFDDDTPFRELLVDFGNSGYVALYRHNEADDTILVLAFRHQREAGY